MKISGSREVCINAFCGASLQAANEAAASEPEYTMGESK